MTGWTRRALLAAGVLLAGALPFGLRGCRSRGANRALATALDGWFADDAADAVGRRVLALGEGWNTAEALLEALAPRVAREGDAAALRAGLADAIREDFRADRVIAVEGWLLAQTEARLYALAVLRRAATAPAAGEE